MPLRFNHMELTVPVGELEANRQAIKDFYADLLDWESLDVPILGQNGLLLRTDPETSQFILVTEQKKHMSSPGYDHLGLLCETRAEVDALLAKTKAHQGKDDRVQIKEYEDLVTGGVTTHAFYVRHLLPIWLDIQVQEFEAEALPARSWKYA